MTLKGLGQPHLCFHFTCKSFAIIFYSEHVETKKTTVKLLKIIKHILSRTVQQSHNKDFSLPCNIIKGLTRALLSEVDNKQQVLIFIGHTGRTIVTKQAT